MFQPHPKHQNHLCKLWTDTLNVDEIKSLVKNSAFICRDCGRVAAKEDNLCDPVPLWTSYPANMARYDIAEYGHIDMFSSYPNLNAWMSSVCGLTLE